jgi:flagellar biosynthesis chaperone FliJ
MNEGKGLFAYICGTNHNYHSYTTSLSMEPLDLKQSLHTIADELPVNATFYDALERLYLLSKLENALEQYQNGEILTHAQVESKVAAWLNSAQPLLL